MEIAVVIPCHHRVDLLARACEAVAAWPVFVVDDSRDGALVLPPGLTRVRGAGEQGFGAAVNLGMAAAREAGASHVLVLNDDAVPAPGCVEALAAQWGPDTGAVGPVIYGPEGVESAGMIVQGWGRVMQRRTLGGVTAPFEVDALSGAALLLSADSRFDPAYRHGFEDVALCRTLAAAGKKLWLVPEARCLHLGGASLSRTSRIAQRHAVSGHLRLVGGGWRAPLVLGLAVAQVLREGGPWARLGGVWEGWRDYST